jgi:hypothetical protein
MSGRVRRWLPWSGLRAIVPIVSLAVAPTVVAQASAKKPNVELKKKESSPASH